MSEFEEDIMAAMDEVNAISGEWFVVGSRRVQGSFSGGDESIELTTTGGSKERFRGTLVLTRSQCQEEPELMSIITDAKRTTRYRITTLDSDAVSWTLTLTAPNARR